MKQVIYCCLILLCILPLAHSQQDQLLLWFGQDLKNFGFNIVVPLEDRVAIYDSEDPGSPARTYANKGELLEVADKL